MKKVDASTWRTGSDHGKYTLRKVNGEWEVELTVDGTRQGTFGTRAKAIQCIVELQGEVSS